jgi:hypothetical protein
MMRDIHRAVGRGDYRRISTGMKTLDGRAQQRIVG